MLTRITHEAANNRLARLSPRQRDVARLVARDAINKEIAKELGISVHVVRHYLRDIFPTLGVESRVGVAVVVTIANRGMESE